MIKNNNIINIFDKEWNRFDQSYLNFQESSPYWCAIGFKK